MQDLVRVQKITNRFRTLGRIKHCSRNRVIVGHHIPKQFSDQCPVRLRLYRKPGPGSEFELSHTRIAVFLSACQREAKFGQMSDLGGFRFEEWKFFFPERIWERVTFSSGLSLEKNLLRQNTRQSRNVRCRNYVADSGDPGNAQNVFPRCNRGPGGPAGTSRESIWDMLRVPRPHRKETSRFCFAIIGRLV